MPTLPNIEGVAQYLYWLCGQFQLQARNLTPGSPTVPLPPITIMPPNLDFYVADSGTPFVTGQTEVVLPQFIGYNMIFSRDGVPQSQANNGTSNYFSWNPVTGLMKLLPNPAAAAVKDELFSINPV